MCILNLTKNFVHDRRGSREQMQEGPKDQEPFPTYQVSNAVSLVYMKKEGLQGKSQQRILVHLV